MPRSYIDVDPNMLGLRSNEKRAFKAQLQRELVGKRLTKQEALKAVRIAASKVISRRAPSDLQNGSDSN